MTWIQTYTGMQYFPLSPKADDVRLTDIGHHLSMKCRFAGACRRFYSVAEHSVRVLNRAVEMHPSNIEMHQWALLHDAAEAYLPDVCRPIKPTWNGFDVIETANMRAILEALGVPAPTDATIDVVKYIDNQLLATEARDLMAPPPAAWEWLPPPIEDTIRPWPQDAAKVRFIREAQDLGCRNKTPTVRELNV